MVDPPNFSIEIAIDVEHLHYFQAQAFWRSESQNYLGVHINCTPFVPPDSWFMVIPPYGNFMGFDPTPCIIMYPYHISTIIDSFASGHENFQHAWPSPMEPMAEVEANVIPSHTETRGSHRPRPTAEWRTGHKKATYIDIHMGLSENRVYSQ